MAAKSGNGGQQSAPSTAMRRLRMTFVGLAVFSLFLNLLMLTGPLYMLQVYDRVLASQSIPTLIGLTVLVAVLYAMLGLLEWARQSIFSVAASRFEADLSDLSLDAAFEHNLSKPGQSSDQALRDLRTVRRFMGSPALASAFDLPFAPIFFAVLFMLHWAFGVWAMAGGLILYVLAVLNQAMNQRALATAETEERRANARVGEMMRNAEVIFALGMKSRLAGRWREQFETSDGALTRSGTSLGFFTSTTKAFRLLLQSGILGLGAWLAIEQQSSPGSMVAASILMGRAIAPIEQIVGQWRSIVQARASWASLKEALAEAGTKRPPMELPPITGAVSLSSVIAAPPGSRATVLKRLSLEIAPGEIIGVIGPSASGKSSLARVITGAWPVASGKVRLDGAEISAFTSDRLGQQIGYLPQQVDLFSGTIRENISRFDPDATPEAIISAAVAAGCHDLILRIPGAYDAPIGEGGAYLSAGQRQRVGLARALYGQPRLVVLDEPNANLDHDGDMALQSAIAGLKSTGATVLVIAHRPAAILHCNRLVVIEAGEIKLDGPRDEILARLAGSQGRQSVAGGAPHVAVVRKENQNG